MVKGDLTNFKDLDRFFTVEEGVEYSKAQKELGYTTRSYSETMRDCINWLKETGKLD